MTIEDGTEAIDPFGHPLWNNIYFNTHLAI
jgi:hypothetical protein